MLKLTRKKKKKRHVALAVRHALQKVQVSEVKAKWLMKRFRHFRGRAFCRSTELPL